MNSKLGLLVVVIALALLGYGIYRAVGTDASSGGGGSSRPSAEKTKKTAATAASENGAARKPGGGETDAPEPAVVKKPDDDDPRPRVRLVTSMGDIVLELNREKAPRTVENFLRYAADRHYDGTIFHRVAEGFVIQGGHFTEDDEKQNLRDAIPNEATNGLSNERGTIAMARSEDPDSALDQFYFNLRDNAVALDHAAGERAGYTVFGRVTKGLDVVDAIGALPTVNQGGAFAAIPKQTVLIKTARRE